MQTAFKVLHIDTEKGYRGGQRQVYLLAKGLAENGVQSEVITRKGSALYEKCVAERVPASSYSFWSSFDFFAAFKIAWKARHQGFGIVHAHAPNAIVIALLVKLFYWNIKIVVTRRVSFPLKKKWSSRYKYSSKYIDKLICISKAVEASISGVTTASKCSIIPDCIDSLNYPKKPEIDIRALHNISEDTTVIGTVAAFTVEKDYQTLINTAKLVLQENAAVRFVCCGDGPERTYIEDQVKQWGIDTAFVFTGHVSNVLDYIQAFDIFLLCSKVEGLGSSILDAQHYGKPVVASNAGGIPELIEHNINGLLVDSEDAQAFTKILLLLAHDVNLQDKLNTQAQTALKKYELKTVVEAHRGLYKKLRHKDNCKINSTEDR